MKYIMKRGSSVWCGSAESMWASEVLQVRRSLVCALSFDEFKRRLDEGETLVFGGITVSKHDPGDIEILVAAQRTAEHQADFYRSMEKAVKEGRVRPL